MRRSKNQTVCISKQLYLVLGMIEAMRMLAKPLALAVFFMLSIQPGLAQDLNARVQILSPQVQNTNKRALEVLEKAISDFLNNRTWSATQVQPQERIDCSFVIT